MFNPKTIYLNDLLTLSDNKRDNLILEKNNNDLIYNNE